MKNRKWKEKRRIYLSGTDLRDRDHGHFKWLWQYLLTAVSRRNLPNR